MAQCPIEFTHLSASWSHTCAVASNGELYCWGDSQGGHSYAPALQTTENWSTVSAGSGFSCGTTTLSRTLCWGYNEFNQIVVPSTASDFKQISSSVFHSCGVTEAGGGACWGRNQYGEGSVPGGQTWMMIAAGQEHSCGITTARGMLCWGTSSNNRLVIPTLTDDGWALVSAGAFHTCAITTKARLLCWGYNEQGQTVVPGDWGWSDVSCGDYHTCGVTVAGTLHCWGSNLDAQCEVPSISPRDSWKAVASGGKHSCGQTMLGDVYCWGSAADGKLLTPTTMVEQKYTCHLALLSLTASWSHTCAVASNGEYTAGVIRREDTATLRLYKQLRIGQPFRQALVSHAAPQHFLEHFVGGTMSSIKSLFRPLLPISNKSRAPFSIHVE